MFNTTVRPADPSSVLPLEYVVRRLYAGRYLFLLGALLGAAVGFGLKWMTPTTYAAAATILVRQASAATPSYAINTVRPVITNHRVATTVVRDLSLPVTPVALLRNHIRIEEVPGTYLLRLIALYGDPQTAATLANRVADEAIKLNAAITASGDDKLQHAMTEELTAARKRMNEAEQALTAFRTKERTLPATALHVAEVEGARLHAEYDLATRLYEEIAVQYGNLRLQVAQQATELIVIEEAFVPEEAQPRGGASAALLGATVGAALAFALIIIGAVFLPVREPVR